MITTILYLLLEVTSSIDTNAAVNNAMKAAENVQTGSPITDLLFKLIVGVVVGGTGIYKIVEYVVKKNAERKEKNDQAKIDIQKTNIEHDNILESEMFKFDKEMYLKKQSTNDEFQRKIIDEIFSKYVTQNEWINKLHDKNVDSIVNVIADIQKVIKDIYIQNDLLSNRMRNVEDKFVKNTNQILGRVETLVGILAPKEK